MDSQIIDLIEEKGTVNIEFLYTNEEVYDKCTTESLKEALEFFRHYREGINQGYLKVKIS